MKFTGVIAAISFGSALAAPLTKKADPLATITGLVSGLKSSVESQLASIVPGVGGLTTELVPEVQSTLQGLVVEVQGVAGQVLPIALGLTSGVADVEGVTAIVSDATEMISGIQTTLEGLVGGATSEVVTLIQPEVTSLMQVVGPLASPLVQLGMGVVNTAGGAAGVTQLLGLTQGLQGVASGLLAPVSGVLSGLLGGGLLGGLGGVL